MIKYFPSFLPVIISAINLLNHYNNILYSLFKVDITIKLITFVITYVVDGFTVANIKKKIMPHFLNICRLAC